MSVSAHALNGGRNHELTALGWNPYFEAHFNSLDGHDLVPGRVAVEHRGEYVVFFQDGELRARPSGRLRHESTEPADLPAVGDWVAVRIHDASTATVEAVLPRRSGFSRKEALERSLEQVVAANIDVAVVVNSLENGANLRRIERYIAMAWGGGAQPVVALTKADLFDDPPRAVADVQDIAPGVVVLAVSAVTKDGIPELQAELSGNRTGALMGPSGAGKSTIINELCGSELLATRAVREDGKGRHTTSHRQLVMLPGGGMLIDTPGMRELQLWDDDGALRDAFEDIAAFAEGCRFRDCRHDSEPGCAVRAAIASGELDGGRLESFSKLGRELRALERRRDARAAAEERRKYRAITRSRRSAPPPRGRRG